MGRIAFIMLMEILFVSHKHPPFTGGMEKQSFELINGMKRYANVHSILYEGKGSKARFFWLLKTKIYACCKQHPGISIIHYNDGLMAAWCRNFNRYPHIKRTATLHGLDVVFPNYFYQRFILPAFNRFHLNVAVSRATAQAAILRGIDANKVVVIQNGVDESISASRMGPGELAAFIQNNYGFDTRHRKILVAMGRAVKRKGFSWFITEVMPLLDEDVVFMIVGPFDTTDTPVGRMMRYLPSILQKQAILVVGFPGDEARIGELIASREWKDKVVHVGKIPFDDIERLLGNCDAFVMPNIAVSGDMEGFGLVCLEASLCGATVFAAGIDGITDAIYPGGNGYLLPSGNAREWANALSGYLQHGSVNNVQIKNGRDFTIAHFGWDKMVQQYYEQFHSLVVNQSLNGTFI